MSFFGISLIMFFIIKIKYFKKPVLEIVYKRYGNSGLKDFRRFELFDFKLKKLFCDLDFLISCFNNHLIPHFLRFKTSSSRLIKDSQYRQYQTTLLQKEIDFKRQSITEVKALKLDAYENLKSRTSFLDFNHFIINIQERNDSKIDKIKLVQKKKLFKLGLKFKYEKLSPDELITNLSSTSLTDLQKEALGLGLKFRFNPLKIDYTQYFLSFEKIARILAREDIYECIPNSLNYVKINLKSIALKYYYSFKNNISPYHKSLIESLKKLSKNKNIIVTRPDKGTGTVILNKCDYYEM